MGLCFSGNTKLWGKKDYPYSEVLPLAVLLWLHFYKPVVKVIVYLVRSEGESEVRAQKYEDMLRQIATGQEDRLFIRWIEEGDMSCVLKSQVLPIPVIPARTATNALSNYPHFKILSLTYTFMLFLT